MSIFVTPYVKHGVELDQVVVQGVRVTGRHGVLASERETGQVFLADVVAHVSTRGAAAKDDLAKTVNYSAIADRAAEILGGDPSNLLETVAEHIAHAVLEMPGVHCVDVEVHKPQAPLHVEFKDVSVKIRRDLRTGGLWADKRIGSSAGLADDPLSPDAVPTARDAFDQRPLQPVPALLAFGGNVGEVATTFTEAVFALDRISGIEVKQTSALYRTTPIGGPSQPDFLNAVVRIATALSPRELLAACQGIEMVHGRGREVADGPRTLDIDLITYADVTGELTDLTLPHPRAHERAFVLVPWAGLEPSAELGGPHGGRVADLAQGVASQGVQLVADTWPKHTGAADSPPAEL